MNTAYVAAYTVNDFGQSFASLKYSATLAATTDTTLTIPGSSPRFKALIKVEAGAQVWVALNATAAVPAGGTFAATTSELVTNATPLCREVRAGDVLHFYTATASTDVGVVLYATGVSTSGF
ncbi:MAG: hypothetical protein AB7F29_13790 [Candidatus Nitrosocosmicus sp.]